MTAPMFPCVTLHYMHQGREKILLINGHGGTASLESEFETAQLRAMLMSALYEVERLEEHRINTAMPAATRKTAAGLFTK